ncbi:hypothetical protein INT44_008715 [Umbelopsis vinacea]|uniref:Uncharacterized protein n=1 Tax=Umbelopsis vinacea TaxID=44442 RepID=A0A8H7UK57_9FUNG|nr:hypothetical protein INT44_008715 [Umbelopsis vinacea]
MKRTVESLVNESGSSKRIKVVKSDSQNHAPDCSDPDCDGCDVGEVELTFTNEDGTPADKPTALELFRMAMSEAASEGSKANENGMAKRIFDMALEAYDKEKDQDQLGYAQCLIEFGRYFDVLESVKEGVEVLRGLEKSNGVEGSKITKTELYIAKGRGILVQLQMERAKKIEIFEEINGENESDEDEEIDPSLLKKLEVSKQERKLVDEAVKCFDMVLGAEDHKDGHEKQALLCCNDLRQYGEQLDMPFHVDVVRIVLKPALTYLQTLKDLDSNAFALKIWGSCLFYQARADPQADGVQAQIETALEKLNKAKSANSDDQDLEVVELIGHCKMLLSTLLTEEDDILQQYQEAIDCFKLVLEQSDEPNHKLAEMVQLLDGEDDDDLEEEEDEQEDDEDNSS